MLLHNADKKFLYGLFHEKCTNRKLFFVLFNLKNLGIQVNVILRQVNSLKAGEKKIFGPILVRPLEL